MPILNVTWDEDCGLPNGPWHMRLTRPYVRTTLYEAGRERMPFQGRMMMPAPCAGRTGAEC
jgi:hypothetical protein